MEFGLIGETVNLWYRENTLNVLVDTTSPTLNWACHISAKACSILAFISEQWNIQHVFQNTCNIKITNYCITYLASNIKHQVLCISCWFRDSIKSWNHIKENHRQIQEDLFTKLSPRPSFTKLGRVSFNFEISSS